MPEHANILALIDREIAQLQQARTLFSGGDDTPAAKRRGRPAKALLAKAEAKGKKSPAKATRQLSEEARARIAAGQKKRWAAQKKASAE